MEKKVIELCLIVLICLAIMALFNVHFAATKERHAIAWEKARIDSIQHMDSVKENAKMSLDTMFSERMAYSKKSLLLFCILLPVCLCLLWLVRRL